MKIKQIESTTEGLFCKGKFIKLDKACLYFIKHVEYGLTYPPIIISETEEIEDTDTIVHREYGIGKALHRKGTKHYWVCKFNDMEETETVADIFKVLVLPEHFSPDDLKTIASNTLKDNDEVMVECEKKYFEPEGIHCNRGGEETVIKLTNNHITAP